METIKTTSAVTTETDPDPECPNTEYILKKQSHNGLAWLWHTQTLAVTIMASGLLALLCLAATAINPPSSV